MLRLYLYPEYYRVIPYKFCLPPQLVKQCRQVKIQLALKEHYQ
jgi:hypothetical protein